MKMDRMKKLFFMTFMESRYEVVFFDYNDVARSVWLVK